MAADTMKLTADDVQTLVIPGIGHWLAEQAPDELVAALTAFLAPYRDGTAAAPNPRPHAPEQVERAVVGVDDPDSK